MAFEGVESRADRAAFLRDNNRASAFAAKREKRPIGKLVLTPEAEQTFRAERESKIISGILKGNK